MMYDTHSKAVLIGVPLGLFALQNIIGLGGLLLVLRHYEKKEKAQLAAAKASANSSLGFEQKTVIVENKGPQGGRTDVAQVVTTGPTGTQVSAVPTGPGGTVVVSTTLAGIPGGTVTVEPGKAAIVKAEHPPGRPMEAKIVSTTHT